MRPCLVLIIASMYAASPAALAQQPGSHAATPATALAARPVATASPAATTPRSQSAFGRAMAELTRAARASKPAAPADAIDPASAGDRTPAAATRERSAVVATTRSDP